MLCDQLTLVSPLLCAVAIHPFLAANIRTLTLCLDQSSRYNISPMLQLGYAGPDPECDRKCANGGWCNSQKVCQCLEGYMGQHCRTALCYPQCMNGGICTSPGKCSCLSGFQGRHCEGGEFGCNNTSAIRFSKYVIITHSIHRRRRERGRNFTLVLKSRWLPYNQL